MKEALGRHVQKEDMHSFVMQALAHQQQEALMREAEQERLTK
ncbi:hypothetical protein KSD_95360 [Ktedonobacter sp. SOSP1-85]|nr:hypothetical protein KSD_95360 [Ktedonobacter sp. SOSP1-85]